MSEPVRISVEVVGADPEMQAINCCIQLLEDQNWWNFQPLTAVQKERIAAYLMDRYRLSKS